jgi:hypothetical protein
MTNFSHLFWSDSPPQITGERVYFSFDPAVGLTDVDFHLITGRAWEKMKSPSSSAVAEVEISPQTSAEQIIKIVDTLSRLGGYKQIEIYTRR